MRIDSLHRTLLTSLFLIVGCSGDDVPGGTGGTGAGPATGGSSNTGATGGTGGTTTTGGTGNTSGNPASGGTGATSATGGTTGGSGVTGGTAGTGSPATGGAGATGGTGGTATGGAGSGTGGSLATGGAMAVGGAPGSGGMTGSGGASGGMPGAGGTSSGAGGTGGLPSGIVVNLGATHQTIQGFGLNDALSPSGSTFSSTILDNLFTTKGADGIGLSILRIGMTPTGSLNGSTTGDIDGAKSRGAKIIGSCWSPPANCKSNNNTQNGGHTLTSCYDSWSTTIANFAKQYGLYAMSIGNEPDFASCGSSEPCNGNYDTTLYTANEMVAFVKVAGPKLQANGVKVIAPEASEWIHQWSNTSASGSEPGNKNSSDPMKCGFPPSNAACDKGDGYDYGHWLAKDATAWAAFDIIGVHEYDTQHAEPWPADVTAARKEVWQTEMSGVKWWKEQGPSSDINNGVAVAGWIHSALVTGEASAWLYWWYKAYYTDDNEGLLLKNGNSPTKRYYTLGNYSKFVRPGFVMVDVVGNSNADVLLSAFKGPDNALAVVAINKGSAAVTLPITISGGTAPAMLTPNVTSASDNLKAGTAVAVTGGTFMASLPSKTVTTFASQ